MNRRELLKYFFVIPLSCGKNNIQAIPANPKMFLGDNYIGKDGYEAYYFKYNLKGKEIEIKTNPSEDFGILPGGKYPELDSLYIEKIKLIRRESGKDVYTIVGIVEKE